MSTLSDQAVRELAEKSGKYTPGEINDYLNKRLNAAAKSSSSPSFTGPDANLLKKVGDAAAAGFYDRLSSTKSRISVDTVKGIIDGLNKSMAINPIALVKNVLALGLDGAKTLMSDLAQTQDDLLKST
ncbi:MAG: hypothetical protein RL728_967, partial [Bacteroidota bacterium]